MRSRSIVFIGTSRIQAGLNPLVWADSWNGEVPIQLAVSGGSPLPVLENLADDESFRGLVIVDVPPRILFSGSSTAEREAEKMLRGYHNVRDSPARILESRLRIAVSATFVFRRLRPQELISRLWFRTDPHRFPYLAMDRRRFTRLNFANTDLRRAVNTISRHILAQGRPPGGDQIHAIIERLDGAVSRIQRRGGRVVLIHMPHSGAIRELEDRLYPREIYWDVLAANTEATAIHFADYASLSGYPCPDGSHLDVRDTTAFTSALARIVRRSIGAPAPDA